MIQEEAALSWQSVSRGDTAFGFDFAFFVAEVDGLHRTQSTHVHCTPSQEDSEFPLGENRHRHHAHRTFYRGSPIPMSLRRDSLSLLLSLSLSRTLSRSLPPFLPLLFLSLSLLISLLLLSLFFSLPRSMSPVVLKRRSFCALPSIYTHVRVDRHASAARENPRGTDIHARFAALRLSFSLSLHLAMQFSPLLRHAHLPLHYGLLFASVF